MPNRTKNNEVLKRLVYTLSPQRQLFSMSYFWIQRTVIFCHTKEMWRVKYRVDIIKNLYNICTLSICYRATCGIRPLAAFCTFNIKIIYAEYVHGISFISSCYAVESQCVFISIYLGVKSAFLVWGFLRHCWTAYWAQHLLLPALWFAGWVSPMESCFSLDDNGSPSDYLKTYYVLIFNDWITLIWICGPPQTFIMTERRFEYFDRIWILIPVFFNPNIRVAGNLRSAGKIFTRKLA